jgi:lipid-binding SYLF domain-containing protein
MSAHSATLPAPAGEETAGDEAASGTTRRVLLGLTAVVAGTTFLPVSRAWAESAAQLRQHADAALRQLYASQPKAKEFGARARAILIFPSIIKAGFIVGGQSGNGVLRQGGKVAGYYNISAASFGLQAGGQSFSYALFFMNDAALNYLTSSDGWSIGSGPSVVVVDKGAAASLTSTTISQDVYAFPFGQKGLMAGLGLEGSKITRIKPPT